MSMSSTVEFYYFPMTPLSRAVWMVFEELGLKYEEKLVDVLKGEQNTAEFRNINSRQKVPAIRDGDFVLTESRAIAGYLVSEYGAQCRKQTLYPQEAKKQATINQHLYISENFFDDIMTYVNIGGVLGRGEVTRTEKVENVKSTLGKMEMLLGKHAYTVEDHLTIADFFYYIAVGLLDVTDYDDWKAYPKVVAWKNKMAALPYHKKTCEEPLTKFRAYYQGKVKENAQKK